MNQTYATKLRQKLAERFLVDSDKDTAPPRQYLDWKDDPINKELDSRKTLAMRLCESHFGEPLEKLLSLDKRGVHVAKRLGISPSTVTRWRQRLGLSEPTGVEIGVEK